MGYDISAIVSMRKLEIDIFLCPYMDWISLELSFWKKTSTKYWLSSTNMALLLPPHIFCITVQITKYVKNQILLFTLS